MNAPPHTGSTQEPPPPQTGEGSEPIFIACAIVAFPQGFTLPAAIILLASLKGSFRRAGIRASSGSYHRLDRIVCVFRVEDATTALRCLRDALNELDLLDWAEIARYTAEEIWLTVHTGAVAKLAGSNVGGTGFQNRWLSRTEIEACFEESSKMCEALERARRKAGLPPSYKLPEDGPEAQS